MIYHFSKYVNKIEASQYTTYFMKEMFMKKESWEIELTEKDVHKTRAKLLAVCAAAITISMTLAEHTLVAI